MSRPKPAGEWTVKNITKCYDIDSITATRLAFDINAALAAEREKVHAILKEIKGLCGMPSERRGKSGMGLVKILNVTMAGLAKVKEER